MQPFPRTRGASHPVVGPVAASRSTPEQITSLTAHITRVAHATAYS